MYRTLYIGALYNTAVYRAHTYRAHIHIGAIYIYIYAYGLIYIVCTWPYFVFIYIGHLCTGLLYIRPLSIGALNVTLKYKALYRGYL